MAFRLHGDAPVLQFLIGAACGPFAAATSSPPAGSPTKRAHPGKSASCEALCELMCVVPSDLTVEAMRENPALAGTSAAFAATRVWLRQECPVLNNAALKWR